MVFHTLLSYLKHNLHWLCFQLPWWRTEEEVALYTPEKLLIGGVDLAHSLPLLCGPPPHTGWQKCDDVVCEIGRAGVGGGQHLDVGEPIRGFPSVPLTHQKDAKRQKWWETWLPAAKRNIRTVCFNPTVAPALPQFNYLEGRNWNTVSTSTGLKNHVYIFLNYLLINCPR